MKKPNKLHLIQQAAIKGIGANPDLTPEEKQSLIKHIREFPAKNVRVITDYEKESE